MAKKKPKSLAEIANIQVGAMKRLAPNAAAWLLGVSPRSLRDFVDLDRDGNGCYNGQALVEFAIRRGKRPTLPDTTVEQFRVIADQLSFMEVEHIRTAFAHLQAVRDNHGDGVLLEFVEMLLADWQRFVETHRPPAPDELELTALSRGEDPSRLAADRALQIAILCPMCDRLRVGRTWLKKKPPTGWMTLIDDVACPKCEEQ